MSSKLNLLLTLTTALITISLFSCMENSIVESKSKTNSDVMQVVQNDSTLSKSTCSTKYVTRWITDELTYIPVDGKKLGFNKSEFASISEMKEEYGFSKVMSIGYTLAINAGFLNEDIIGSVNVENLSYTTGYDSYYIDEPIENNKSAESILNLARKLYPKKLIIGSYIIDIIDWSGIGLVYKTILMKAPNIYIMSDNYYGFYILGLISNQDQRGYWEDFKNNYGSKNIANWISLIIDSKASRGDGDFHDLLGWANDNGLKEMWLYVGDADDEHKETLTQSKFDRDIKKFVEAAYFQGWLKRKEFQREYLCKFECLLPDPCSSCDQEDENAAGWLLVSKVETGRERTIIR